MSEKPYDIVVVGGGIVGLATAYALRDRYPQHDIAVLEKEASLARHQTGNNSGVVHAGIYYRPGSLKAKLCLEGVRLLAEFCEEHGLKYERCGKVIVATSSFEVEPLGALCERALANGVPGVRMVDQAELKELEPYAAGLAAIHSPNTAIVDYREVAEKIAELLTRRGVEIHLNFRVEGIHRSQGAVELISPGKTLKSRYLVNCAGLYSDHLARMDGLTPSARILPFRGEYYFLKPEKRSMVRGLIYPVANANLPFLGVHFTRTVHGEVEAGPNAVLAWRREGYSYRHINLSEFGETLGFPGFWRLAKRFWRIGAFEYYRSLNKSVFLASLQRLVPSITAEDIVRGGAGVRAQAVTPDGLLADDFIIERTDSSLHVLNAPSPAATASLAIGRAIAQEVQLAGDAVSSVKR